MFKMYPHALLFFIFLFVIWGLSEHYFFERPLDAFLLVGGFVYAAITTLLFRWLLNRKIRRKQMIDSLKEE
jgi:multisubunit Na+/H+ antiporter MnhE subunit